MVPLPKVVASNAQIRAHFPQAMVAVFAGATSGIGEATLKAFVRYNAQPRVYLFARSTASLDRLRAECSSSNANATLIPVLVDLSSMRQTDRACQLVLDAEPHINLVFHSAGEVKLDKSLTDEGLHSFLGCVYYSKLRIIQQLLPRLEAAATAKPAAFARVVAVAGGGKEGEIDVNDLPALTLPLGRMRSHLSAMITVSLEQLAMTAPHVGFIHDYPGTIRTSLFDGVGGIGLQLARYLLTAYSWLGEMLGWPGHLRLDESAERHVFLATSAAFPSSEVSGDGESGVPRVEGVGPMRGSDGREGSGVYSLDWDCEPASAEVEARLRQYRETGVDKLVWQHSVGEFERIGEV